MSTTPLFANTFFNNPLSEKTTGFVEPSKTIPEINDADVIVCGGGPSGFAAAISAARQGARTTLIEMYGCLGGIWTTGLLSHIIDYQNKPGIMKELVNILGESDAQYLPERNALKRHDKIYDYDMNYDTELMKWTLDRICLESGVNVRLHTKVVAAYKGTGNRLEHVVTESFSGREAWKARVFVDCTGNGDLAAHAGCRFDLGHPETGKVQPFSLMAIIAGLDEDRMVSDGYMGPDRTNSHRNKLNFYQAIKRAGIDASYTMPTLFGIRPGLIAMMANHQYGASPLDADQVTIATIEARNEVNRIVDALRAMGGSFSGMRIVATGSQIGFREARRIHGLYTVSANDLINGSRFNDAVCRVTFPVDVHSLNRDEDGGYGNEGIRAKPYDIPLRSLIAKDVDGLMMAGRCISGDFFAHASYRVTGNAVAMGEAAGRIAGKAALKNKLPGEIEL